MENKIFNINKKTKKIELEPISITEHNYIDSVLVPHTKREDLGNDEIFYKMKSIEAGIRYKLMKLIALKRVQDLQNKKR